MHPMEIAKKQHVIKELLGTRNRKHCHNSTEFSINGQTVYDDHVVADSFNDCFLNLGPSLATVQGCTIFY